MKALIAALFALSCVAASAQSSTYQNAAAQTGFCHNVGGLAGAMYDMKERGQTKEQVRERLQTEGGLRGDRGDAILLNALDYSFDKAADQRDAQMAAWAYCMDRLPR